MTELVVAEEHSQLYDFWLKRGDDAKGLSKRVSGCQKSVKPPGHELVPDYTITPSATKSHKDEMICVGCFLDW